MSETSTLALPCEDDAVTVERVKLGIRLRPQTIREVVWDAMARKAARLELTLVDSHLGKRESDVLYAAAKDAAKAGMELAVRITPDQHTVLTSSGSPWPCQWEVEA